MGFVYLGSILFSLAGLAVADWRYKLVLFFDLARAICTIAAGLVLFLAWDLVGIAQGIFFTGESLYDTGIFLLPEIPVEEVFFLLLLTYLPLLIWRFMEKKC